MNENVQGISALSSWMEELGLVYMASGLESFLADQSRGETILLDSVRALVDLEYVARKERTARTRLLDDFDLSWLKGGLPRERFEELKSLAFVERKENVLLLGPSGVGKTHVLPGLGQKACLSGYTAYYLSCRDAIEMLLRAKEQKRLLKKLSWLRRPHVLLLDEVGYEPLTAKQAYVFFQLINTRYETGSIVMTSTKPFSKWAELMSDEAVATAMLDRLLHHALIYSLKGDSYRMRDRLRVGAVGFD
jgi:DNA replication protein DnaC